MLRYALLLLPVLTACSPAPDETTGAVIPEFEYSPANAQPTPTPSLTPGLNHFVFRSWPGPEVPVWVYVPLSAEAESAPIMFMMHGAKRGAARYLSEWDQVAEAEGFIVVAPEFSKALFPSSSSYNRGRVFEPGTLERHAQSDWTFSTLEPIFDLVLAGLDSEQDRYTLYGHSAGSQFAHRYMYFVPDARVKRFLPANAGWYTMPDLDIEYPYGLKGTGVTPEQLRAVLENDVVVLLGDQDNDPNHESLRRSAGADLQGTHRFARGKTFYETARASAEQLNADFAWEMRVVQGVAHKNGGIAAASGDLIE
ncbi:MAG: hypothetical protein AAFX56_09270 [Pseudomonadota bacterium]